MLKQGKGAIVNVSSAYGYKPSDVGHAPYCAQRGQSRVYALRDGGPLFAISSGVDESLDQPVFRDESAGARGRGCRGHETWLCSDAARFVNGAVLPLDGGDTARLY